MTINSPRQRPAWRRPLRLALVTLLAVPPLLTVSATGAEIPQPVEKTEGAATAALQELVSTGTVPTGLQDSLGYRPVSENGYAGNPGGDCSSPVALPASFQAACRTHDLGYDLLRMAEEQGESIAPELRRAVDQQFFNRIMETCGSVECEAKARAAATVVTVNTIRQHSGAPVEESWPWES